MDYEDYPELPLNSWIAQYFQVSLLISRIFFGSLFVLNISYICVFMFSSISVFLHADFQDCMDYEDFLILSLDFEGFQDLQRFQDLLDFKDYKYFLWILFFFDSIQIFVFCICKDFHDFPRFLESSDL